MSLFLRMDAACIEALTEGERAIVDPITYTAILEACATVAQEWRPAAELETPVPRPPATQWIRANLVIPDDFAWRSDLSFDQVEATNTEAGEVVIVYRGGRTTIHEPGDHLRVAVNPNLAIRWNADRMFMGESTLRLVAEAYGVF
jgi:hypothetical protein